MSNRLLYARRFRNAHLAIPGIISPLIFRPVVIPGNQAFNIGPFNFVVPHFNTLEIELYGAGAGAGANNEGQPGGTTNLPSLGLTANPGIWSGGVSIGGTATGFNTTAITGTNPSGPNSGANGGPAGGASTASGLGNPLGGGGGGGFLTAGGFGRGGGAGAYGKSVYNPAQINVGTTLSGSVGAGGAAGTVGGFLQGDGARGEARFTWS